MKQLLVWALYGCEAYVLNAEERKSFGIRNNEVFVEEEELTRDPNERRWNVCGNN